MLAEDQVAYLEGLLELLENAAHSCSEKLGRPKFIDEPGKERFEYQSPTSLHFQVLKAMRLVSLLNASLHLWKVGHFHEMAIILRSIYESVGDIDFIQEGHVTGNPTEDQKRMVQAFFLRKIKTGAELMIEPNKINSVPRKKVRASIARMTTPIVNSERVRRLHQVIEETMSAYVHGELTTIMELYAGGRWKFRLSGMFDTKNKHPYLWQFASTLMNCMNSFIVVASNLSLSTLANEIQQKRKELERSEVYTRGRAPKS